MGIVYQYCDTAAFMSIMERKVFWLTPTNHMNDYNEVKYVWDVFNKVVHEGKAKFVDEHALDMINKFTTPNRYTTFISCFSDCPDILSQWRAYASNGDGFSIGIETSQLNINSIEDRHVKEGIHTLFLSPVNYLSEKDLEGVIINNINKFNESHQGVTLGHIASFSEFMRGLAETTKGSAFSEEKEIRIVYQGAIYKSDSGSHEVLPKGWPLKYRVSGQKIIPYCELEIPSGAFCEVYLGPRNTSQINDVKMFLESQGLSHVEIKTSTASYR